MTVVYPDILDRGVEGNKFQHCENYAQYINRRLWRLMTDKGILKIFFFLLNLRKLLIKDQTEKRDI